MSLEQFLNKVTCGDCLNLLPQLPDNSVDMVCTDPPYELGFMGKKWDNSGIAFNPKVWSECLRVLKPSGWLCSFGGTRTFHRIWCAIQDAGFDLKDTFMWVYGSGFPKCQAVDRMIDKRLGVEDEREVIGKGECGYQVDISTERKLQGYRPNETNATKEFDITAPASEEAKKWVGWKIGAAGLKPAWEPVCIAQKPSSKTIIDDVMKFGVGAVNVDACRVPINPNVDDPRLGGKGTWSSDKMAKNVYEGGYAGERVGSSDLGRFPANIAFDDASAEVLDEQVGVLTSGRPQGVRNTEGGFNGKYGSIPVTGFGDSGGASRFFHKFNLSEEDVPFFYCAKAGQAERNKGCEGLEQREVARAGHENKEEDEVTERFRTQSRNIHPTCKPLKLIEHLLKLYSRPNAIILDPFMGSGTLGVVCKEIDRNFIGFELESEYCKISEARINNRVKQKVLV